MEKSTQLRIIFMGTPAFAATILRVLLEKKYNIVSVYTRPDKKIGRNQEIVKSAVKEIAEKEKLEIFQPETFNNETIEGIKKQNPDMLIVAAYGKILPKEVLSSVGFGAINVHTSLLPKFRGPSPVQNAILEGEEKTGTTIMLMNEGIDTGDILSQKEISILSNETYPELLERLSVVSTEALLEVLPLWVRRKITPQKQDETKASYCQIIERQDGKIIWSDEAADIYNRFRAFYSWPGIFTYWEIKGYNFRLKIHKLSLLNKDMETSFRTGEVFADNGKILVQTGRGVIILEEVQLEGKAKTTAADFINGYPDFIGSILK